MVLMKMGKAVAKTVAKAGGKDETRELRERQGITLSLLTKQDKEKAKEKDRVQNSINERIQELTEQQEKGKEQEKGEKNEDTEKATFEDDTDSTKLMAAGYFYGCPYLEHVDTE